MDRGLCWTTELGDVARRGRIFRGPCPGRRRRRWRCRVCQSTLCRASAAEMQRVRPPSGPPPGTRPSRCCTTSVAISAIRNRTSSAMDSTARSWRTGRESLDGADEVEVGVVPVGPAEVGARLQQQRVALAQHDVAHPPLEARLRPGARPPPPRCRWPGSRRRGCSCRRGATCSTPPPRTACGPRRLDECVLVRRGRPRVRGRGSARGR
jgi:hypothetical protein